MARTLTYRDIKAGMKKAGEVPCLGCERVEIVAWLAAAGYGIACRPSLVLYQRFRAAVNRHRPDAANTFSSGRRRSRRRRITTPPAESLASITTVDGAAKKLGINYPSQKKNPVKRVRKERVGERVNYAGSYARRKQKTQAERNEATELFKQYSGFYIAAAIKAHHARPSQCFISSAEDTLDGKRSVIVLHLPTANGMVTEKIPTFRDILYHYNLKTLHSLFHIGWVMREPGDQCSTL